MRGKERNDAFFSNQKPKQTVSLQNRFKAARAQGTLNMSSCSPPLTAIPAEVFEVRHVLWPVLWFWCALHRVGLEFLYHSWSTP
jgi:hypothetical protein